MQVSKLMPRPSKLHWSLAINLKVVLIHDKGVIGHHRSDLILFLLSADKEHFVVNLD